MGFLSTPELRAWLDLSMITKHVLQGFQNLAAIHRTETKLQSHMLEERAAGLEGSGLQVEWADSMANNTALKASEPGPDNRFRDLGPLGLWGPSGCLGSIRDDRLSLPVRRLPVLCHCKLRAAMPLCGHTVAELSPVQQP